MHRVETGDPDKPAETLDELMAVLSEEAAEQVEVFGRWVANYLAGTPGEDAVTGPIRSAGELNTMLATKLQQYGERLKEEARKEGRAQAVNRQLSQLRDLHLWIRGGRGLAPDHPNSPTGFLDTCRDLGDFGLWICRGWGSAAFTSIEVTR